jgi:predicted nucleic-acid-binding protein
LRNSFGLSDGRTNSIERLFTPASPVSLGRRNFALPFPEATRRAVDLFQSGPADFADYLVGELDQEMGCTITMTFDQDAGKGSTFTVLTA